MLLLVCSYFPRQKRDKAFLEMLSLHLQTIFCSTVVYSFQTVRNVCITFDMVKDPLFFAYFQ